MSKLLSSATIVVDAEGKGHVRTIAEAVTALAGRNGRISLPAGTHIISTAIALSVASQQITFVGVGQPNPNFTNAPTKIRLDAPAVNGFNITASGISLNFESLAISTTAANQKLFRCVDVNVGLKFVNAAAIFSGAGSHYMFELVSTGGFPGGTIYANNSYFNFTYLQDTAANSAIYLFLNNCWFSAGFLGLVPTIAQGCTLLGGGTGLGLKFYDLSRLTGCLLNCAVGGVIQFGGSGSQFVGCYFANTNVPYLVSGSSHSFSGCSYDSPAGMEVSGKYNVFSGMNLNCVGNFPIIETGTANYNRFSEINVGLAASYTVTLIGPNSSLDNETVRTINTSPVTLDLMDRTLLVDATGGARLINLPAAATCKNRRYTIRKIDSSVNLVTIDANAAELIDGNTTVSLENYLDGIEIQSDGTGWQVLMFRQSAAHEPMGFPVSDDTYTTFSWDNIGKILTIAPVGPATAFDVWVKGVLFRKGSTAKDISATVAEGIWYFYFDGAGVLQGSQVPYIFSEHAPAVIGYYDATAANMVLLFDERHALTMDWNTHEYLHETRGMAIVPSGFGLSGSITGSGAADVDAQVGMAGGDGHDEDLEVVVTDGALGVRFRQPLAAPSQIPVYYRTGAALAWRKKTANAFPVLEDGANRIKYNLNTAGTWTQPNVTANGRHMAMWICATNNYREPIIAILGQREDTTLANSQLNNTFASLSLAGLPSQELKVLWRVIYQTADTYANVPHARIRDITDYRSSISLPSGGPAVTSHNALTGRDIYAVHPRPAIQMPVATVATTPIALSSSYDVVLVDTTVGHITLNLPPAADYVDRSFTAKKITVDAFTVILDADGADTIDGAGTWTLTAQYDAVRVVSDGTNWHVVMYKFTSVPAGPTLTSATGTSANAYASILSLAGAGGILGYGTVKNTLAVNTITIRRSATDAFGTSQTTEDDILPSASFSYDIPEPIGTAVPPYTAFAIEVKSKVGGSHSDYNLKNSSL